MSRLRIDMIIRDLSTCSREARRGQEFLDGKMRELHDPRITSFDVQVAIVSFGLVVAFMSFGLQVAMARFDIVVAFTSFGLQVAMARFDIVVTFMSFDLRSAIISFIIWVAIASFDVASFDDSNQT